MTTSEPQTESCEFASLVYRICTTEKQISAKVVAHQIGMGYDAFMRRARGEIPFAPAEVRAVLGAIKDWRLVDYVVGSAGFILVDRTAPGEAQSDLYRAAGRAVIDTSQVLQAVGDGLRDGRIDPIDVKAILKEVVEAEGSLAAVRIGIE